MKEIKVKVDKVMYEAIDGTQFEDKVACLDYERTAKAVIRSKFKKLVAGEASSWDLHWGIDDNTTYMLKLKTEKDADIVLQALALDNNWILGDGAKDSLDKWTENIHSVVGKKDDYLLVGASYDDELYLMGTLSRMIEHFKTICNESAL